MNSYTTSWDLTRLSQALAELPPKPPLSLAEIGMMRNDGIDALGLGSEDENELERRLRGITDSDHHNLIELVFSCGKLTLDALQAAAAATESPTALWAGGADARRMIGQTLLWADNYLFNDGLADRLLSYPQRENATELAAMLAAEARLRPLLEAGVIALVPQEAVGATP